MDTVVLSAHRHEELLVLRNVSGPKELREVGNSHPDPIEGRPHTRKAVLAQLGDGLCTEIDDVKAALAVAAWP